MWIHEATVIGRPTTRGGPEVVPRYVLAGAEIAASNGTERLQAARSDVLDKQVGEDPGRLIGDAVAATGNLDEAVRPFDEVGGGLGSDPSD